MIKLWNLNSICHLHLLWFGIYLHLVTANKIWPTY
jgi:hypothetical protein